MLRKIAALLLITITTNMAIFGSETEKEKKFAQKVKSEIAKLGTGTDARITVKLKDGTKVSGYVSEIKADSFVVADENTSAIKSIPYSQAKQVRGNNLSSKTIIGIAIGVAVGVLIIIIAGRSD